VLRLGTDCGVVLCGSGPSTTASERAICAVMRINIGGGVRLFVDVAGSHLSPDPDEMRERPVLLVLHGGPGTVDHSIGRPYFDRFADTHCVVYFDHRGNGRSDQRRDPSQWTMDVWADDVSRLCDALDIRAPVILGNSFGGTVAAHAAGRHPELPSKVVLMSTSARRDDDVTLDAFERIGGRRAREVAARFRMTPSEETALEYDAVCMPLYSRRDPFVRSPRRIWMNIRVLMHYMEHIAPHIDITDSVAAISCPTLVLVGEDDPICPPAMSEAIVSAMRPNLVRFERFVDCGHGTFRDQPERTEGVLRDFLAS
jgi:pimeloyl-ACP methyl ester carboxylesterase